MTSPERPTHGATLQQALRRVANHERVLVASDFDGVLAPIVLDPSTASPQPGTLEVLRAMAAMAGVTVAIVSGRDLATLRRLTGLTDGDGITLIGSHGAESSAPPTPGRSDAPAGLSPAEREALDRAQHALEQIRAQLPDVRIEHKPTGVVLHTRGLPTVEADAATAAALAVPDEVPGVHAMRGKSVVELSVLDVSKGAALRLLATDRAAEAVVYFGDDVTDETVFGVFTGPEDVMVKVGDGPTEARYRLDSCADMPETLALAETELTYR